MSLFVIFAVVTSIGTAILTVAGVAKLLLAPLTSALRRLEEAIDKLGSEIDAADIERQNDVKAIWKYLAEHR